MDVSAPEPAEATATELAALRQEIEQVHAEVHELADRLDDLERAWDALPAWLRWLAGRQPRSARPEG